MLIFNEQQKPSEERQSRQKYHPEHVINKSAHHLFMASPAILTFSSKQRTASRYSIYLIIPTHFFFLLDFKLFVISGITTLVFLFKLSKTLHVDFTKNREPRCSEPIENKWAGLVTPEDFPRWTFT